MGEGPIPSAQWNDNSVRTTVLDSNMYDKRNLIIPENNNSWKVPAP